MDSKPDTIKISASHREEIYASHAHLYVTVKGSSLVSGNEALKKAREVSQLVESLVRFGLTPDAIHLEGVRIATGGGGLLKSSSAIYHLKVKTENLDQLAPLLDILAEQKNASLDRIEWRYPEEEARENGLGSAISRGRLKAERVAAALGVTLLGVYEFMENVYDEEGPPMPFQAKAMEMRSLGVVADAPALDMELQHSKTIHVNVEIWYRVSSF